ncbi:MAG TPA: NAD(P)-binding domain-containing protein [Planctomycetota bacterium]|nr:NAD(P)-binding domain-containing protein [Planctomycetota bacterium]
MTWGLLVLVVVVLAVALWARRGELVRIERGRGERTRAREQGSHAAQLQYPHVDLSRCLGCGSCVEACPEEGVLELLHGQAAVVHGARCVGHARCAEACPVGAIAVRLADVAERRDLPALTEALESNTQPGLFLAGEVTGYALVRTAIGHGTAVAAEVARRRGSAEPTADVRDLVIVGAGPAGLACALESKRHGLDYLVLEQGEIGGTVAKYPRRKMVLTQPVELPLVGMLANDSYSKEDLLGIWQRAAAEHELAIRTGEELAGVEREEGGGYAVRATSGTFRAHNVCLALGRRGTPRRLGVPVEELEKVSYGLLDAHSFTGRRVLVVGGGDSAIEAALGLAEQPGNTVHLSYRKGGFFRIKARNERRLEAAVAAGELQVVFHSDVRAITPDAVELEVGEGEPRERLTLANDEVFVFAGGTPPFGLLEQAGVSFDPADRIQEAGPVEAGTGLVPALAAALALALVALVWTLAQRDYYAADGPARAAHALHDALRPSSPFGIALGLAAVTAICTNLAYLLRRSARVRFEFGSLKRWMTAHVATGVLALLLALVHGAMRPGNTVGGHAFLGLVVLVSTGAVGRYLYAFVPRAANGRELAHDELRGRLAGLSAEWDRNGSGFAERVQQTVAELARQRVWKASLPARLAGLFGSQRDLGRSLAQLEREGRDEGVDPERLRELLELARRAHRAALAAAHFEDLRGLLATWRWVHRWAALLMVLLVARHVAVALRYGGVLDALWGAR